MAAGRVVKGVNFVGLRDAGDPVELACRYDAAGADELVFLDIAATHQGRETLVELVERTASQLFIPFTVGGGIRSLDGITALLRAGADKVSLNSSAVKDPELISLGPVSSEPSASWWPSMPAAALVVAGMCMSKEAARTQALMPLLGPNRWWSAALASCCSPPWMATAPKRATTWSSPAAIADAVPVPVIASGGAGCLDHIAEVLESTGAAAALLASLLHDGVLTVEQIKADLQRRGVPVRPLVPA